MACLNNSMPIFVDSLENHSYHYDYYYNFTFKYEYKSHKNGH